MLLEYGLFLAKTLTFFIVFLGGFAALLAIVARFKSQHQEEDGAIEIRDISAELEEVSDLLESETLSKKAYKALLKSRKQEEKADKKKDSTEEKQSRLFVIQFEGDMEASETENLRESITAVLLQATENDEILVILESAGGYVHSYGLAASQLQRLRKKHLNLTIAIDSIAASGGYLMASVANKIIAAPFAIVGSIGVIAELPNFNRLLKRHNVDYEQYTAGRFKRTVSVLGENTDEGRAKFQEELEDTHALFKTFVSRHRPTLDIDSIATGEHWHASQARHLGLVDEIMTSDDYILSRHQESVKIYAVSYEIKEGLVDKLSRGFGFSLSKVLSHVFKNNF